MVALAGARIGVMALGLPISIATIDDEAAWASAAARARAFSMTGALCIHPRQIGPINRCFGVSADEVDDARRVLDAWRAAANPGALLVDGRMVDLPVVLAAQRVVARHRNA